MRHDLDTALDECLLSVRGGMSVEQCLARYPEYADELRPLLRLALNVARVPTPAPSSSARVAAEQRMLEALAKKQQALSRQHPIVRRLGSALSVLARGAPGALRPAWQMSLLALVVIVMAAGGVSVAVSAGSIPGDAFYSVKLASQRMQLALTVNPAKQQLLSDQFATQRRLDVQAALAAGQQATVEFEGVLQQVGSDLWLVSGVSVHVQPTTQIVGEPYLGAIVKVEGKLPGNGELVATRLDVKSETAPWPAPTLTYTPSPEPTPTATPSPTQTPVTTETAEPTQTTEPTRTPSPTRTLQPTETPGATETSEPAETEDPEGTSEPAETLGPEGTPEHEGTGEATSSPEPHETDEDEETPEPSRTPGSSGTPDPEETPTPTEEPDD